MTDPGNAVAIASPFYPYTWGIDIDNINIIIHAPGNSHVELHFLNFREDPSCLNPLHTNVGKITKKSNKYRHMSTGALTTVELVKNETIQINFSEKNMTLTLIQ